MAAPSCKPVEPIRGTVEPISEMLYFSVNFFYFYFFGKNCSVDFFPCSLLFFYPIAVLFVFFSFNLNINSSYQVPTEVLAA